MYRAMSKRKSGKSKGGNPKKLLTVSAHFRQNLDLLMERIFSASPHFVRCIKPNQEKKALKCNDEFMMKQLRYTGMLEAVRVRREGYAYRPYFSDFFNSYRGIAYRYTDVVSILLPHNVDIGSIIDIVLVLMLYFMHILCKSMTYYMCTYIYTKIEIMS